MQTKNEIRIVGAEPESVEKHVLYAPDTKTIRVNVFWLPTIVLSGGGRLVVGDYAGSKEQAEQVALAFTDAPTQRPQITLCYEHASEYLQRQPKHSLVTFLDGRCDVCGERSMFRGPGLPMRCDCGSDLTTVIKEDGRYFVLCMGCGRTGSKGHDELRALVTWFRHQSADGLPTWQACRDAVEADLASVSALHKFIYNNEPAGKESEEFRKGLTDLIREVEENQSQKAVGFPDKIFGFPVKLDSTVPFGTIRLTDGSEYGSRVVFTHPWQERSQDNHEQ